MIKEILASLKDEDRKQLMYAFENQFAQFIELPNKYFIGVNTEPLKQLEPLEVAGVWAYGRIR